MASGKKQRARSRDAVDQLDTTLFSKNQSAIRLERDFRFQRSRGGPWVNLGGVITDCGWSDTADPDASPVMTGTLSARLPEDVRDFLRDGDRIKLDCRWGGAWKEVWTMRVWTPSLSLPGRAFSCELMDDLFMLQQTQTTMDFAKTKKRPKGWKPHEIVTALARRYRFPVAKIPRSKHFISLRAPSNASVFEMIRLAYKKESAKTGRDYVMGWSSKGLTISPVSARSPAWHFSTQIRDAEYATKRGSHFCTSLLMRCTVKEKGKTKKLKLRVISKTGVNRYGYIEKTKVAKDPDNETELRRVGQHLLARRMVPERSLSFTHGGVPFLKAGEAARVTIEELGLKRTKPTKTRQDQGLVIVEKVDHSLTAGDYVMNITARFDPFASRADIIHADAEKRAKKRRKRQTKKEGKK